MQANTEPKTTHLHLVQLAGFARYMLEHKLEELAAMQLKISREMDLPMLRYFEDLTEEQLLDLGIKGISEILEALAANKAEEQVEQAVEQFRNNQLPIISSEEIVADDISLTIYIRKKSLLYFLPDYTDDTETMVDVIRELDLYQLCLQRSATNVYIQMLKERIQEHAHFIEKITNTSPGIIYVYNLVASREIYTNRPIQEFLGYELSDKRPALELIHPSDVAVMEKFNQDFLNTRDGEIRSLKLRMLHAGGEYRWIRSFETVFRRNEKGDVVEKIGIAIDVHDQKVIAEKLEKREAELLEAQEIGNMGSFFWDFAGKDSTGSPQVQRILEVDFDDQEGFFARIHPGDKEKVKEAIDISYQTGIYECEYRYRGNNGEKVLWTKGKLVYRDGQPVGMHGTIMETTEKHQLIRQLKHQQEIYKQVEELANMGNWSWDLKTGQLEWTDQLYRMYGLQPQSEAMTIEKFLSFIHPDDLEKVKEGVEITSEQKHIDYTFRIITRDGKTKIIRSIAKVEKDKDGNPVRLIGTERDVTERQSMVEDLKKSEQLYKQAQALAHVGNWSWDMLKDEIYWSDEQYRIYGIEQGTELNYQKYINAIHPDDVAQVKATVANAIETGTSWTFTHRLITPAGVMKIVYATGEPIKNDKGEVVKLMGTCQDITERQLMLEKLQKSEQLYKQAQALANIGNWSWEVETDRVVWSEELYRIYELEPGTPLNYEYVASFIHPDDYKEITDYLQECIRTGKIYDKHHRIVLENGKEKVIHRRAEIIREPGRPVTMIGTTQDITEIYRVQQELRENQNFIRKITDATPSIITTYNVNTGEYVFISEGLEKLLGYHVGEVQEKGIHFFMEIIHPDDLVPLMERNNKALQEANQDSGRKDVVAEFTYRMKNIHGDYRWFHTYGTIFDRNAEGKVEHVLNISLDITDQKLATEKIKEQEHFIQQIADASPTILYLYDVEMQRMAYINREVFFVLGYLPDEIIESGSGVTELLYHPDDYHLLPARKESFKNFSQVDSMIQYECRIKSKDEEYRWFLVREIVFNTNSNGEICQILGAALDINRRKEMEKTILQNTLLLEQSNASLEEFAYVASHDLKEPLRKISTFGDRLAASQESLLTPEGKLYLRKILDASQRMQTMISDLLSISMITGNRSFEQYSLQRILDDTIQTLEFKIEQQGAVIRHDNLPEVRIVPSQFRQLFQNLLSNSLKFVREEVRPVISISHEYLKDRDIIHYQLTPSEQYLKITISDNGIGFENEFANKIFAIFQRLHGRSEYEGSGIGLAICKKIVEHHGGIIYAEGKPGMGATFVIILPA